MCCFFWEVNIKPELRRLNSGLGLWLWTANFPSLARVFSSIKWRNSIRCSPWSLLSLSFCVSKNIRKTQHVNNHCNLKTGLISIMLFLLLLLWYSIFIDLRDRPSKLQFPSVSKHNSCLFWFVFDFKQKTKV